MEPLRPNDPRIVGSYRLLGRLGAGGMGQVFLGESPGGRKVAVKLMLAQHAANAEFRQRFAREVAAARQVGGFHTAPVVDADPAADPPWMVTAYIPGPSLHDAVEASGPLGPAAVRTLGAALAEGLAAVHACGLVHRDLKPSNIILADDGPRIIDFGIARAADATVLTSSGVVIGTFSFMSPEQVSAKHVGPASRPSLAELLGWLSGSPMPSPAPTVTAPPQVPAWPPPPVQPPPVQWPPPVRQPTPARTEPPVPTPVRRPAQPRPPARTHRPPPAAATRASQGGRFVKPLIAAALVIAVAASVTAWLLSRPKWIPGPGVAYVTNDRGIVPVNLTTGEAGNPIAISGTPYGIALGPQNGSAYVIDETTCRGCAGTVGISNLLPVNLTTGSTGHMTAITKGSAGSGNEAFRVVLSKNGQTAYVMNGSGVVPVDLATGGKGPTIGVGNATSQIAISPDGRTLYVSSSDGLDLVPVDLRTGSIGKGIDIGATIQAIAPAPAGGNVYVYDAGGIASVNPVTRHVNWQTTSAELGDGGATAGSLAVMPDGLTAYAGGAGTGVVPINLRTHQVGQLIRLNDSVTAIMASPDGKIVYVGGSSGAVYPINVATNQLGKAASTGNSSALQSMTISS